MQKAFALIFFIFYSFISFAQEDSIVSRIVLIGDAGKFNYGRQPVVDAAKKMIPMNAHTTVIYLGDNLYKTGMPESFLPAFEEAKSLLDSQIHIASGSQAKVIFIPGNHDWTDGNESGLHNVMRQQAYIESLQNPNIIFLPSDGCPGPVTYKISKDVLLIIYDSQWFIQEGIKPGVESDCEFKTPEQFYTELEDIIRDNKDKLILLAGHHTLKSYGIHGGYFTLKQHIFPFTDLKPNLWIPLPIIGTIYPIARGVFGTPEDLKYPAYANMINRIEKIVKGNPNIIFAGGHEHNLQLISDSSNFYIVSGAGSKKTRVSQGKKVLFAADTLGFASLEISKNKNVNVGFYTVTENESRQSFSKSLFNYADIIKGNDTTDIPEAVPEAHFEDSVTVAVNKKYDSISSFHRFFAGENYRKEWATPIHLKVFRVNNEMGGFSIGKLGGGKQTKSLRLTDKKGKEWTLRTVDKDPAGVVPDFLKGSVAQKIVQDMISAQHPFGAAVVPDLANAAGIIHAEPKYYFVPDDPAMGKYRQVFANKICLLEPVNLTPDQSDTKSTLKVINKILEDSKNTIDQEAILRARLLDMVIGDWDRHFDQWKFGASDTGTGKLYYPIPKDRDQAFFNSDGLLVKAAIKLGLPYLQGFKKNYPDIKAYNWEERDFDRIFMNNLDRAKWESLISDFQKRVNDSVIQLAVKKLPPEIFNLDSIQLVQKLISRKNLLSKEGIKYYHFLAKEVNVTGSNENEYFSISNVGNGLHVKVFKRKHNMDSASLLFDRIFDPKETKYVNLYGLNGEDKFVIDSGTSSKIKLRIIGGEGIDTFLINGSIRNKIYDYLPGNNYLAKGRKTRNFLSDSYDVNKYEPVGFKYNQKQLPLLNVGYNGEDKVLIGAGFSLKEFGFRKTPYARYQKLGFLFSPFSSAFQVEYTGIFNQVMGPKDLVIHSQLFHPVLNNFYGLGNKTTNQFSKEFSRVRYKYFETEILIRQRYFNDLLQVFVGPSYTNYWARYADNGNKVLGKSSLVGLDSASIFNPKHYAGGKFAIYINNLNSELLPTRGVVWNTLFSTAYGLNKNSKNITSLTSDLQVFASLSNPAKVIAVLRFGGGHIFNENFEYFQALTLGSDNYLRGYRKNRFAGQSYMYQNTELRIKLFDAKSYIVSGPVGLIIFNDVGRVWMPRENSKKWHNDFGGGIYFAPFNIAILSATIAHSPEENLFNFSLGTKFNLTF